MNAAMQRLKGFAAYREEVALALKIRTLRTLKSLIILKPDIYGPLPG